MKYKKTWLRYERNKHHETAIMHAHAKVCEQNQAT